MSNLRRWTLNLRDGLVSNSPTAKYLHGDPPMMRDIVEVVAIEDYYKEINGYKEGIEFYKTELDEVDKKHKSYVTSLEDRIYNLEYQLDTANKLLIGFAGKDGYDKVNEYFLNLIKEQYK